MASDRATCGTCKHFYKPHDEYPCNKCSVAFPSDHSSMWERSDLYPDAKPPGSPPSPMGHNAGVDQARRRDLAKAFALAMVHGRGEMGATSCKRIVDGAVLMADELLARTASKA